MTRKLAAALLVPLLAAGCTTSHAAPQPVVAAPTPSVDTDRAACHALSQVEDAGITASFDTTKSGPVADLAVKGNTPAVAAAGHRLAAAVTDADAGGDANIDLQRAWIGLASACGGLYGDGPW